MERRDKKERGNLHKDIIKRYLLRNKKHFFETKEVLFV